MRSGFGVAARVQVAAILRRRLASRNGSIDLFQVQRRTYDSLRPLFCCHYMATPLFEGRLVSAADLCSGYCSGSYCGN
jgi:hypothetical protein